ncbi:hypothetical protein [Nonomuraea gerenzanensis]|uniref:Uncharacterized protein n=1 Tax=Nonomuraea gerenzanensis TaxID=93944 RepID=A0A1M4EDN7_9ACTN|nr:hypothetical protein [Nonomuraea gerenzanensis]UBU08576.1 hypothetical protein LCN96_29750 [Nonomuraea gerenzanensis]SBO96930.1 hypothetical protein BN4615_P6446 [Nonomuraea gerenzanensis]
MTDELETLLRAELGRAAERAPKAPPRLPSEVVARSNRRRTARTALVAGVCVVAVAVPAGLAATRGTDRGDVATSTIAPDLPPKDYTADAYRIGEAVLLDNPSQNRPISLWYARTDAGTALCVRTQDRSGGSTASCGEPLGGEAASEQGSTERFPGPATGLLLYYGTAGPEVARVTAVTSTGKLPATIHHPTGTPRGIWTVTVPSAQKVTAFEVTDAAGKPITRLERQPLAAPEASAEPVGRTLQMPGKLVAGLYETPDQTLIWKLDGRAVGRTHTLSAGGAAPGRGGPLVDMAGKPMDVELGEHGEHWFGITSDRTARVRLVFRDGTTVEATTRADPWRIGGFRLFAGTQRHSADLYRDGFRIVGYGEDGAEVWREDHPGS